MSSPTSGSRSDARANRRKILAAADRVYAAEGVDVTLDRIAQEAGVGVGTVYRNFANKGELIEAVLADRLDGMLSLARSCAEHDDAREGLFRFLRTVVGWISDSVAIGQLLDGRSEYQARLLRVRAQFIPLVEQLIIRAQRDGQIRADFSSADLPMFFTMLGAVQERAGSVDPKLVHRYADLLLDAIALPEATSTHPPLSEAQLVELLGRSG
ncbi:MAG: TetR/AcrR family transcriptional regulator [Micrococcales bacterium]|nr:TetR/AcrR family transcriptional regulator [Micrococcales bacterium]MDN5703694.1 TetR/AcrR family transcriptional regulator [Micrococcales bacterium]